ncbi:MAG: hypothetical protein ACE5R6_04840 [Candidatus Heimdallarchaeota archaeon]
MWNRRAKASPAGLIALFEDVFRSWKDSLGAKMVIATFINLVNRDIIELVFKKQRKFLGRVSLTELVVHQKRELPQEALERRVALHLSGPNVRVRDIILNFWDSPVPNPYQVIERWVKDDLVRYGLMEKIEEKVHLCTKVEYKAIPIVAFPLQSKALELKNQIEQFQKQHPQKFKQLRFEVNISLELRRRYPFRKGF